MPNKFHKLAVIDIGSNSVRLAIFDREKRGYLPIFNEKGLCGLGKNLTSRKILDDQAKLCTLLHMKRFAKIVKHMKIDLTICLATAALRVAEDATDFIEEVKRETGFQIEVISAEREAYYAALGVRSGLHSTKGYVADLGGASLEVMLLDEIENKFLHSYEIGGVKLQDIDESDQDLEQYIKSEFNRFDFKAEDNVKKAKLYLVGGGFRTVGKAFLDQSAYEPKTVHHFSMIKKELLAFCHKLIHQAEKGFQREDFERLYPTVSGKRAGLLPYYAHALIGIIERIKPKEIIFSAYGVKEGVFFDHLSEKEQKEDPLLVTCRLLGKRHSRFAKIPAYTKWAKALFKRIPKPYHRLFKATAKLTDLAWMDDEKARGHIAFWRIAHMQLPGVTHRERIFMATILYVRYEGNVKNAEIKPFLKGLVKDDLYYAEFLGSVLRLGAALSVGDAALLSEVTIDAGPEGKKILLNVKDNLQQKEERFALLYGEVVQKRLRALQDLV
jgi:exopolyphosphatase/guanosine-5'-triphosphate,3'-diphosphate pyrophosphatase